MSDNEPFGADVLLMSMREHFTSHLSVMASQSRCTYVRTYVYIFVLDNKHNGAAIDEGYSGGAEGKWRRPAHTSVEYATLRNRQMSKSRFLSVPPPLRAARTARVGCRHRAAIAGS